MNGFVKRLFAILGELVPEAVRAEPGALGRARNHVVLSAIAVGFGLPIAALYGWFSGPIDGAVVLVGASTVALSILLVRVTRMPRLASLVAVGAMYAVIAFMNWRDGSRLTSSLFAWFALVPVVGSFVGGFRQGMAWGVAALAGMSVFAGADALGMRLSGDLSSPPTRLDAVLNILFVGIVGTMAIMFQLSKELIERKLSDMALHDTLTGLPNRRHLSLRMDAALQRRHRSELALALLYLDLDGFKGINDVHGHGVGDEVLKAVAKRLAAGMRSSDTVARLAGDEFVALLEDLDAPREAAVVAQHILERLREPLELTDRHGTRLTLALKASIGIAYEDSGLHDIDTLLAAADQALYAAKNGGRGRYEFAPPTAVDALGGFPRRAAGSRPRG